MGKYRVIISESAIIQLAKHKKSGNASTIKKIENILKELEIHPKTGTGKPEELRYELKGLWSRRINQKDRIIYEIIEEIVTVEIISVLGHYGDK